MKKEHEYYDEGSFAITGLYCMEDFNGTSWEDIQPQKWAVCEVFYATHLAKNVYCPIRKMYFENIEDAVDRYLELREEE